MMQTLAIGPYSDDETRCLTEAVAPLYLAGLSEIAALSDAQKASVRAVAYKGHTPFGQAEMAQFPNLGIIANYGVGYDAIDVRAASAQGVKVTNTPDVLNDDVADLAIALLLMQGREMEQASAWARSGAWAEQGAYRLTRKISGGVAGIVGLGRIGREIADRLAAFKMDIHYWSRAPKKTPGWTYHADPVSLAHAVDYLIVALVGGPDTRKFVSHDMIDALGPHGVIVNVSRGSTLDEAALLDALETKRIAGAALDVFENEPDIDPRFFALTNVVLQPHQGSGTVATRAAMIKLQLDNILAHLNGTALLTPVN